MADEGDLLWTQVSGSHHRVLSVRLRLLEESCLKLQDLFRDVNTTLTVRRGLPPEKAEEIERLSFGLRSVISRTKSDLRLERAQMDAAREASALVAAMIVDIEELHPHYLKGYGQVPQGLALYLEGRIRELLRLMHEIRQVLRKPTSDVNPRS